jgi:hypothetical protein
VTTSASSLSVRDLRSPLNAAALAGLAPDARIQWRRPLESMDVGIAAAWLNERPNAALRLYGAAAEQLWALPRGAVPGRIELDCSRLSEKSRYAIESVTDLTLFGIRDRDPEPVLAAFPRVRTLTVRGRGEVVPATAFTVVPQLRFLELRSLRLSRASRLPPLDALDLANVDAGDVRPVLQLADLRGLAMRDIPALRSIGAVAHHPTLRFLRIANGLHLDSLQPIATMERLESLDLSGLWQFGLDDLAFLSSMPSLRALRVDIGGRRKNVEIYKRVVLPKPVRFDVRDLGFIDAICVGRA